MARFTTSAPATGASVDVPSSLFLGLVTETDALDLPEGASPDNQDLVFVPGGTDSRPGMSRIFGVGQTTSYVYEKTFVQENEQPLNLYLDSAGIFWQEDVTNVPGIRAQIAQVAPGVYGQSVSAFGREFIAYSDGRHGADIPRQYNGQFFDRVTQDGPATAPTIADITSTVAISSITPLAALTIAEISQPTASDTPGLTVVQTTAAHGLSVGDGVYIFVSNVAPANGYNTIAQVFTVDSPTQFSYICATSGLASVAATGTARPSTSTVVTSAAHGLVPGDSCIISGCSANEYNNSAEFIDATSGQDITNDQQWTVLSVTNPTTFKIRTKDVTNAPPVTPGTLEPGGMISVGDHQVVQMFLTRMEFLTKPSPPGKWTCGGKRQAQVSGLAIGPANVIARVLAATGSGGGFFFTVDADVAGGARSMMILDNTSTTAILDFSDNTLLAAEGIDIPGNNLFAQRTIGPCLGFTFYSSRLGVWGEYRRIENLLNMGFEGGTAAVGGTTPLGWTVGAAGGALVGSPADFGLAWQITGDGSGNAKGQLSQTAYQDYLNLPIVSPSTQYSFMLWAKASAAALTGNIQAVLSAASTGFTATATIAINTCSTIGAFISAVFNAPTPAVIPADLTLTIQETGLNAGATITLDELMVIFTKQPYLDGTAYFSYAQNPEAFDGVTGKLQPADDSSALLGMGLIRKQLVIGSAQGLHRTLDNGLEPADWDVDPISRAVGLLSFRSIDPGKFGSGDTAEEWLAVASYAGLYLYGGGPLWKVSQENQPVWDSINKAAAQTLWIKNDSTTRRIYLGLPLDQATAPSAIYVLDYRELDTDAQIAGSPSVRISPFSGKMLATDMARKWSKWSITADSAEVLARPNGVYEFCVGSGNGVTPGQQPSFGNVYFFDPAKLIDDDYGQISPYWTSYFFVNHEQEQQLQLGGYRKLFTYMALNIAGVGQVQVTPLANALANPRQAALPRTLQLTPTDDMEIPVNVPARRCAFKIAVVPAQGSQQVQMKLRKLIVSIRKHPITPISG